MDTDEPEQDKLFEIEAPDANGCVWIRSAKGAGDWSKNLGPKEEVADAMVKWLRSIGQDQGTQFWTPLWDQKS